jgi:hypothetical protein
MLSLELFCEPFESGFTELEDLELPPEDVPLSVTELEEKTSSSPLLLETSAIGSGSVLLEPLSHAVNTAKTRAMARSMDSLRFASRMTGQE